MKGPVAEVSLIPTDGSPDKPTRVTLGLGRHVFGRGDGCDVVLGSGFASRRHFAITVESDRVSVEDLGSTHGTFVGDVKITQAREWDGKAPLAIRGYAFELAFKPQPRPQGGEGPAHVARDDLSRIFPGDAESAMQAAFDGRAFPGSLFGDSVVEISAIHRHGCKVAEADYLAIGGGIGSFAWVDHLRIFGAPRTAVSVIGENKVSYGNYARYCRNSQIPLHERLRSNSLSTPDNIWGFPGYASREAVSRLVRGDLSGALPLIDVFVEPLRESYTPKAGQVYESMNREASRIGWDSMFSAGRVVAMRRTDDGRYAVAWRSSEAGGSRDRITLARYVHIATGYPAILMLPELQDFKARHPSHRDIVLNAYDPHDWVYAEIERSGRAETVVVRGRGIVASRIIQRLSEARTANPRITIVNQMRNTLKGGDGGFWGRARRRVFNETALQPFNWPKACWGGALRKEIEDADPEKRSRMFAALGGTTTAERRDWRAIIKKGLAEGWYAKSFGSIKAMVPAGAASDLKVEITVDREGSRQTLLADYVIDCTGLIADPERTPFLADLLSTYDLPRNVGMGEDGTKKRGGISVTSDFEIAGLRTGSCRVYAAGTITGGGPYAAVDSFLGLQYAALRAVDHLHVSGAPGIRAFGPLRSLSQWLRWCAGRSPD